MKAAIRNLAVLAALFVVARFVVPAGSVGWADAFTNDRTFEVHFGILSLGTVIAWVFPGLVFLLLGMLAGALLVKWNPLPWAFALGAATSVDRWIHSTYHAYSPSAYVYVDLYGGLLVAPVAACLGAWAWRAWASRHGLNGA